MLLILTLSMFVVACLSVSQSCSQLNLNHFSSWKCNRLFFLQVELHYSQIYCLQIQEGNSFFYNSTLLRFDLNNKCIFYSPTRQQWLSFIYDGRVYFLQWIFINNHYPRVVENLYHPFSFYRGVFSTLQVCLLQNNEK